MLNVSQCWDLDSGHTFAWVCVHSHPVTPCLLKEGGEEGASSHERREGQGKYGRVLTGIGQIGADGGGQ